MIHFLINIMEAVFHKKMFNNYYLRLNFVRLVVLLTPILLVLFFFYPGYSLFMLICTLCLSIVVEDEQMERMELEEIERLAPLLAKAWPIIMSDDIPGEEKQKLLDEIR